MPAEEAHKERFPGFSRIVSGVVSFGVSNLSVLPALALLGFLGWEFSGVRRVTLNDVSTSHEREPLDGDEVERVADLSMLELSDEERRLFPNQLNAILDRVAEMNELDIEGVKATAHPYELTNIFRSDEVEVLPNVRQQALAAAPEVEDHQFRVPPALGEE